MVARTVPSRSGEIEELRRQVRDLAQAPNQYRPIITDAQTKADAAEQAAAQAQQTATDASTTATQAATDAAAAQTTASTANDTAVQAQQAATAASGTANDALTNANDAKTLATGANTTSGQALDAANGAVTTANAASNTAGSAVTTATQASTDAASAVTTANDAQTAASQASTDAGTALSTANSASDTATQAASDAASAVTAANSAASDASTALTNAQTAQDAADSAGTTASAAQAAATQAQTDASNALSAAGDAQTAADAAANAASAAQSTADAKAKTYVQATAPSSGMSAGDVWFDSANGNRPSRYSGSAWVLVQDGSIAAARSAADAAAAAAGDAQNAADTAQGTANAAQSAASTAQTAAGNAQSAADAAAQDAADAAGLAGTKSTVLIQSATPVGDPLVFWIDTTGGANTPRKWNGSGWIAVTDKAATDAADAAATAQGAADSAASAASAAQDTADAAQSAGDAAQTAADSAQSLAASKTTTFRQAAAPSTSGRVVGDLWYDTDNGSALSIWNGTAWTAPYSHTPDGAYDLASTANGAAATAQSAATAAQGTADDAQSAASAAQSAADTAQSTATGASNAAAAAQSTADAASSAASTAQSAADAAQTAADTASGAAQAAQTTADGKNAIFRQTTAPSTSGRTAGDLWFDTDDGNRPYVFASGAWTTTRDATIAAAQSAADSAASAASAAQSAADAASTAASSAQSAADAASTTAGNAQSTADSALTAANGKNKVTYSSNTPSGSGTLAGDLWFQTVAGSVTGQWQWTGSVWQQQTISNAVIGSLDAGKITTGTINAARLNATDIQTKMLAAGKVSASSLLVAGSVTSASGVIGALDAGAITTGTLAAARIATGSLDASVLTAGTITSGLLAANAVIAGKIAANAVTAGTIAASAVTTGALAANAVTADKMAVGTITAASGIIASIDASKITTGTLTGITITASGSLIGTFRTADPGVYPRVDALVDGTFGPGVFFEVESGRRGSISMDTISGSALPGHNSHENTIRLYLPSPYTGGDSAYQVPGTFFEIRTDSTYDLTTRSDLDASNTYYSTDLQSSGKNVALFSRHWIPSGTAHNWMIDKAASVTVDTTPGNYGVGLVGGDGGLYFGDNNGNSIAITAAGAVFTSPAGFTFNGKTYVDTTRTINGKPLSANITLAASDVSAVPTSRIVSAGTGLTGGGALSADRALAVSFGGSGIANTAARSDHTHTPVEVGAIPAAGPIQYAGVSTRIAWDGDSVDVGPSLHFLDSSGVDTGCRIDVDSNGRFNFTAGSSAGFGFVGSFAVAAAHVTNGVYIGSGDIFSLIPNGNNLDYHAAVGHRWFSDTLSGIDFQITNYLGTAGVGSLTIYNRTTTGSANVIITDSARGILQRTTSLRRYKLRRRKIRPDYAILDLPTLTWVDKGMAKQHDGYDLRTAGTTVEDLQALSAAHDGTFDPLVIVDPESGEPEGVAYDRIPAYLIPVVRDIARRVAKLEAAK